MKKTVIIDVTQDDINNGEGCCVRRCAVNLAAMRAFPDRDVRTGVTILIDDGGTLATLPESVTKFITDFDEGWNVSPMQFSVEIEG